MNFGNLKTIARAIIPGAKPNAISNPLLELILNEGVLAIWTKEYHINQ